MVRIYKENAAIAAGIVRKWSSSKCLSKARLMDTQRYTRKVRTCEKDLAKAKENLEKWTQQMPAASSTSNGVAHVIGEVGSASGITPVKEEPQLVAAGAPDQSASSNTNVEASQDGKQQSKQEKGKSLLQLSVLLFSQPSSVSSHSSPDFQDKIEKARSTIESCEKRMEGYRVELAERTNVEARENSSALKLKTWCQTVKKEILSPLNKEDAELSRPKGNNHTSSPIEKAKTLAGTLGIADFPDVDVVLNSFKVFTWCLRLLGVLRRKPTVEEIRMLLAICDDNTFKMPESKCIRMLRSFSSRAQLWQSKAKKALAPDNKTQKPYDTNLLKELLFSARCIPLTMPEESRLWNTIEDKGCRHCICGGKFCCLFNGDTY